MKKLLLIMLMASSFEAFSWGKIGHRVVGEIASYELARSVKKEIRKILGDETLSQVSDWPDFMRSNPKFDKYKTWHYVSIPDGVSYKKSKKEKKGDIITGMIHCEDILRSSKSNKKEKKIALKYLVHLVGDIHQPLHVGLKHDHGGNKIKLKWFGRNTNLHKIWDDDLIQLQELSYTEYSNYIYKVSDKKRKRWQNSYFLDWAMESYRLRAQVYNYEKNKYWEWKYNYNNIKILNKRMLKAGVRLGNLLNNIFSNKKLSKKAKALRRG